MIDMGGMKKGEHGILFEFIDGSVVKTKGVNRNVDGENGGGSYMRC